MAETLDELTYDYEDDGVLVRKQLDKVVLTKGSWATLMFLYQELDKAAGTFRAPKIAIVRFKKFKGAYRKQSSFNVSSEKQARQITEVFEQWYAKMAAAAPGGETNGDDAPDSADSDAKSTKALLQILAVTTADVPCGHLDLPHLPLPPQLRCAFAGTRAASGLRFRSSSTVVHSGPATRAAQPRAGVAGWAGASRPSLPSPRRRRGVAAGRGGRAWWSECPKGLVGRMLRASAR
jgi:hypothetical protein